MSQTALTSAEDLARSSSASATSADAPPAKAADAGGDDDDEALPDDALTFAKEQLKLDEEAEAERKKKKSLWQRLKPLCCRCCARPHAVEVLGAKAPLPGTLVGVDKLNRSRWVRLLDAVGAPEVDSYDPTQAPKTLWGAVFTTLLRLLILILIIWYAIQLFSFSTTVNQGAVMLLNTALPGQAGQQVDVPTLEFSLSTTLTFYEQSSSSLQRIDVQDMTGYNPTLVSTTDTVPLATAFYELTTLDLNSFDPTTQTVEPLDSSAVQVNMGERTYAISTHSFSETMKVLYESAQVYPSDLSFYNHSVYLYVRIPQTALANIKPCQMQLALYNKAVYNALDDAEVLSDRDYQTNLTFPSLVTADSLWQPQGFGKASKTNLVQLLDNDRTLVVLQSRMTSDTMAAFAQSGNWGPEANTDVSGFFNLSSTSLNDTGGLMGQLDFLNWEMTFSYINNMRFTFTNISCDGDDTDFDLYYASGPTVDANATIIEITGWQFGSDLWSAFDPEWLPFSILVVGAMGQEEMEVIDVTGNSTLTVIRSSDPIDFIWWGAPFNGSAANFPATVAQLTVPWTCDDAKYWANDECDCNCGAYDPDCSLMIDPSIANCADQQVCSPSGACVNVLVTNSSELLISETCYQINYPGDVTLAGYLGSEENFVAAGGDQCFPCPSDQTLYDGLAQLDGATSLYTCNVAATAMLSGEDNFPLNNASTSQFVLWDVAVHNAPLPVMGFPYPIQVGVGEGTMETLYVFNATALVNGSQTLTVATASRTTSFKYPHVSMGKLVSALDINNNLPVVIPHSDGTDPNKFGTFGFGTRGPYNIRGGEQAMTVTSASIATSRPFQVLLLQDVPSQALGYVTSLQQAAVAGATSIQVLPFGWWWDSQVGTYDVNGYWTGPLPYPAEIPIVVRGDQDFSGLEVVHYVSTAAPPTWTCDPAYFHADDGCDCNCGLWDPDCDLYSYYTYDSSVNCTNDYNYGCTQCVFCQWINSTSSTPYPTGNCTATDPGNPNPIPVTNDALTYYQLLTFPSPLNLSHDLGSSVETPVPLSDGIPSWYDDSSSYYDVFTYSELQVLRTDAPFTPDDRYNSHAPELTTSPQSVQVEMAMFIVPDRNPFNSTALCPRIATVNSASPEFTGYGWSTWTVQPERYLNVTQCGGAAVNASYVSDNCVTVMSQEALQDYNKHCILEMPPTFQHSFTTVMPVNNKWQHAAADTVDGSNEPEYSFDFQMIYYFGRDDSYIQAEDQFAANQATGGDVDTSGNLYTFYGQLNEAEPGDGVGESGLPANTPYANVALSLQTSAFALSDLQQQQPTNWPTDTASLQKLIASFPTLNFTWDLDVVGGSTALQQVPLLPGYAYFLTAEIEVVTKYATNIIGQTVVDSWTLQMTASTVAVVQLDYFLRQQAVIRYKLSIKDDSYQLVEVYVTTVSGFFGNVGGALAYLAYAVTLVWLLHRLTRFDVRQDMYKKAQDRLKKEKDGAKTDGLKPAAAAEAIAAAGGAAAGRPAHAHTAQAPAASKPAWSN